MTVEISAEAQVAGADRKRSRKKNRLQGAEREAQRVNKLLSLIERVCVHEEEEYQRMLAAWAVCKGGLVEAEVEDCGLIKAVPADGAFLSPSSSSSSSSPFTSSSSSSSSSESSKKGEDGKMQKVKMEKLKRQYTYADICEFFDEDCKLPEAVHRAQNIYCARTGLAHYNAKHGTQYRLVVVEPLISARAYDIGVGLHCNFMAAKPKKKPPHRPCRPKLFYADFYIDNYRAHNISCCIVKPAEAVHGRCPVCSPEVAHCPCHRHRHSLYSQKEFKRPEVMQQDVFCAETALDYYNEEHGTDYELVKPLMCNYGNDNIHQHRLHGNFIASRGSDDEEASSPELFFAEIVRSNVSNAVISVDCCVLGFADAFDSKLHLEKEVDDKCWFCFHTILHPASYEGRNRPCVVPAGDSEDEWEEVNEEELGLCA